MIIDAHVHVFSKTALTNLLSSMKKNKIDKSGVIYVPFKDAVNPGNNSWTLSEFSKVIEVYPELFLIGAMKVTDKKNYKKNIAEIESLLKVNKIKGIKFYLGYEYFFANDARADRLYKLCLKYDVPAIFHTGYNWISTMTPNPLVRYADPLFIDDVAIKYPNLKIIIAHLGNPWIDETAMILAKHKNVYADISGMLSYGDPKNIFTKIDNDAVRRKIVELIAACESPRKLIFGTDFDIYTQKEYIDFFNSIPYISKSDKEYILFKNAQTLFKV